MKGIKNNEKGGQDKEKEPSDQFGRQFRRRIDIEISTMPAGHGIKNWSEVNGKRRTKQRRIKGMEVEIIERQRLGPTNYINGIRPPPRHFFVISPPVDIFLR